MIQLPPFLSSLTLAQLAYFSFFLLVAAFCAVFFGDSDE